MAERKILYFNSENGRIEPVLSDGRIGFRLDRIISKNSIQLNFIIPLNANHSDKRGIVGSVEGNLAIGFEILPNYNIFRSNARPQQPLNSPGLGSPLQQPGRAPVQQPRAVQKSEIYWFDLTLSNGGS